MNLNSKILTGVIGSTAIVIVLLAYYGTLDPIITESNLDIIDDSVLSDSNMSINSNDVILSNNVAISENIMISDGIKHTVPLNRIIGGGPPPDGIPSIDDPKFTTAYDSHGISDSDVVLGLRVGDDSRAYPLSILVWHEIVNDVVGGAPVAVTYCPLCYTSQVFSRVLDGTTVEFGTSGKLYNSNLVMYDRLTNTYWSQALGSAIKGELAGRQLELVPFDLIRWGDWKLLYPDTKILTTDTGHIRAYNVDPYGNYYTDLSIIFPVENTDNVMHPKEVIMGLKHNNVHKAYLQSDVELFGLINDDVVVTNNNNNNSNNNDTYPILLVSFSDDNTRGFERMTYDNTTLEFTRSDKPGFFTDTSTNSEWNYDGVAVSGAMKGQQLQRIALNPGFWFEWVAFYPDTLVYVPP